MLHHDVGTNNHDTIRMINLIEIMMSRLILNVILLITITTMGECNGNTPWRLVGSQGSTETYPSTTRTCITRLGYFKFPS